MNLPGRIACPAADDYQDAMTLIDLANPTHFLALTARVLPWLAGATAILLLVGLLSGGDGARRLPAGRDREDHVHPRARMPGCRCSSGA